MKKLSPQYLSKFCMELRLLLRAGIDVSEGLRMLCDGHLEKTSKVLAARLCSYAESDLPLSEKLSASGLFPQYFTKTVYLGEKSGKLDDALSKLSDYYKRKAKITNDLQSAIAYPLMLFVAMVAVVVVLITKVLPIFNEIYFQLDVQMTGTAASLLNVGRWLTAMQAVILAALATFLVVGILIYLIPTTRKTASRSLSNRGVSGRVSASQFASAMSMAISSGLDPVQAIELAENVCHSSGGMCRRINRCKEYLERGESLEDCLSKAQVFSASDSRLFALGLTTGEVGAVMEEIARRSEEEVTAELDARLRKLGPVMILAVCVVVGLTLISVMLPTIGILSSLG